ncbi:MAG: anthranilate synthase component I family protein [Candidatus Thorarchaeota archaeon]|nr:anthranilate synthase component I family protein [Candidatus Thorarchaeota archaeon]
MSFDDIEIRTIDLDSINPVQSYLSLRRHYPGDSFLLESVGGPHKAARFSILGFRPGFKFVSKGHEVKTGGDWTTVPNPFDCLREIYYSFDRRTPPTDLPFARGMVGYFSYDMVRLFERLPSQSIDDRRLPDCYFMLPTIVLCFDHLLHKVHIISVEDGIEDLLREDDIATGNFEASQSDSSMTRAEYESAVRRAKDYILDGDIFQVVIARRKSYSFKGDRMRLYQVLRETNPSPYMFLLDFEDVCLIGSSPEMLVQLRRGELLTRPIAGTRPRSDDVEEDERLKIEMLLDPKERAEHIMLVDLHRNDLGRVSEYGSVVVDHLMEVEKFSHVQHIVSGVRGRLRKDCDLFDALRASLPAGTVSGAPKIRAMEIIDELEPVRRGPYAGAVGYFDLNGDMDFAINIRSMVIKNSTVYIQAGAGVVADSIPSREYDETEQKMAVLIKALERRESCE